MLVPTKAIVISKLKYRDNDLIVKCYTDQFGIQSYLLRGVLRSKKGKLKTAYFQLLSQLELIVNYRETRSLQSISEAKPSAFYQSIYSNVAKSAIVMFLAEVLNGVLKEEEKNELLFTYLETTLQWLDANDEFSNFHLLFLLNLSKYLGFYPDLNLSESIYFNLKDGKFQSKKTNTYCISDDILMLLKQFLGINFDALNSIKINSAQRQELLSIILLYFELHLGSLKKPRSLQVLNQVFA
ncbi:MAG: DNA repair protein RecO [Flavobacteriaceae bacterium]|nr:DNA repair protein RecO [Flavobacteriaceae bacterium]